MAETKNSQDPLSACGLINKGGGSHQAAGEAPNATYYLHGRPSQRDGMTIARHFSAGMDKSNEKKSRRDD